MTAPETAGATTLAAVLLGIGLGLVYGFLRPLRPKHTALSDFLFLGAVFFAWLQLSFRFCKGDLRFGCAAAMGISAAVWECTAGKALRPVFSGFWKGISGIFRIIFYPARKIFQKSKDFVKFLFASLKKSGTMEENNRRSRRSTGGNHESADQVSVFHQTGIPQNSHTDEDRSGLCRRTVYGSTADASRHP